MRMRRPFVGADTALSPHRARPFLRNVAANPQLPHGRTEASAPTRRCACSPKMRAILQVRTAGSMWASTPTEILHGRCLAARFCDCILRGGGRTPPLRQWGQIVRNRIGTFQFAGVYRTILSSRLRRATSLYTREAWCSANAAAQSKPAKSGQGKPCPYVTTNPLLLPHWVAGFGHELFGVLCFVRADVVDVEHRTGGFVAVGFDPRGHRRVDVVQL